MLRQRGMLQLDKFREPKPFNVQVYRPAQKQYNTSDCGAIAALYAECVCFGRDPDFDPTLEFTHQLRGKILLRLLAGEYDLDSAFKVVGERVAAAISNRKAPLSSVPSKHLVVSIA